jgi:hypothetical protein
VLGETKKGKKYATNGFHLDQEGSPPSMEKPHQEKWNSSAWWKQNHLNPSKGNK